MARPRTPRRLPSMAAALQSLMAYLQEEVAAGTPSGIAAVLLSMGVAYGAGTRVPAAMAARRRRAELQDTATR